MPDATSPPVRRTRRLFVNLSISLGAIVLYLIGLEIFLLGSTDEQDTPAVRDGAYDGIYRDSSDPVLGIELIPGRGVVNDQGYVGTAYPVRRAPGAYRILGLGDSITMYETAEGRNYLQLTERALRARGGPPIEALNFGVASYDTRQEVRQLVLRGLAYEPDLVVVGYCLNDGVDLVLTVNEMTGRVAFDYHDYDPRDVLDVIQRSVATATATVTPDELFADIASSRQWRSSIEALAELAALSRRHGFDVVVMVFPLLVDFDQYPFAPVHDALGERARELDLGFVDLLPWYRSRASAAELAADVVHPNARGHAIAAEALSAHLRERVVAPRREGSR